MLIDNSFDMYSDAGGGDPDSTSPTLRNYHQFLWSKELPNGKSFELIKQTGSYLIHDSENAQFKLGSDAIVHSYKYHKRKEWLIKQLTEEVDELYKIGSTIGAYTIFPNNRVDKKHTINQARGVNSLIDDRFDLTLECIKRHYNSGKSPLSDAMSRYKDFFDMFVSFQGYVEFFLLEDLLDNKGDVKFYLPFNDFQSKPIFNSIEDYRVYKNKVAEFVVCRNRRIDKYATQTN